MSSWLRNLRTRSTSAVLVVSAGSPHNSSLQLGVPFSDPLADGPTIQAANQTALKNGASIHSALESVKAARTAGVTAPIILMGYLNPFLSYSPSGSVTDFVEAVAEGACLVVDDVPHCAGPRTRLGQLPQPRHHSQRLVPTCPHHPSTPATDVSQLAPKASSSLTCPLMSPPQRSGSQRAPHTALHSCRWWRPHPQTRAWHKLPRRQAALLHTCTASA